MKRLYLKQIEYVLTIADLQSFSRAAEKLFISQPSLSRYVAGLEEKYNIQIFERGKPFNQISVTAEGEIFLNYARQIFDLTKQMASEIQQLRQPDRTSLRIGIPLNSITIYFEKVKKAMRSLYPQLMLQLVSLHSSEIEQALRDHKIDLAICYEYNLGTNMTFYPLAISQPLLAIVPSDWDVCKNAETKTDWPWRWLDVNFLQDSPFIKLRPQSNIGLATDHLLKSESLTFDHIVAEAYSSLDVIHHAEIGMGFGFISSGLIHFIKQPQNIEIFLVGQPLELMRIGAATLRGENMDSIAKDLMRIFREVVSRHDRYTFQHTDRDDHSRRF